MTWSGSSGTDFENAANWSTLPVNNLTNDIAQFSGSSAITQPQLTSNRSLAGLAFVTPGGGWVLSGTHLATLALGTNGIVSTGQTNGTNTIAANLLIGAGQAWSAGTGGMLLLSGSVTGTNAFPLTIGATNATGPVVLSPAIGRSISLTGGATNMAVTVRSGGILRLGGNGTNGPVTVSSNTIQNSGPFGALTVNSNGLVEVNSGTWNLGDFGRNGSADYFYGMLTVNAGTISFGGARFLAGGTINVNGGILRAANDSSIYSNGGKFAPGSIATNGTAVVNVTGGLLELAQANGAVSGGNSLGVGMSARMLQSGGTVQIGLLAGGGTNGGTTTSFTIGHSGMTSSGSGTNIAYTPVSNLSASYTLSGGTLLCAGPIQPTTPAGTATNGTGATNPGAVVQPGTNNIRNFNFVGGTLAVSAFNATHLGYASSTGLAGGSPHSNPAANSVGLGTLHNHGGTLAPGGVSTAGRTTLSGNYTVLAGTLAIDLGGTNAATGFQTNASAHDNLIVSGSAVLGGSLAINVLPGFAPATNQTYVVLTAANLTGTFTNARNGTRTISTAGLHSFLVTQTTTNLTLSSFLPVTPPVISSTNVPSVIAEGDAVFLSVTVTSLAPVTYTWRQNGEIIAGATSPSLVLPSFQTAQSGSYSVTVSNAAGSTTQTFTVRSTIPPSATTAAMDADTSRTFEASPNATSWQWILNGETVGTNSTFTYTPTTSAVGTHWLRVVESQNASPSITREWCVRVRIPEPTPAITLHVSPTGSDTANGSSGAPFRTLEKARDTARAIRPLPAGGIAIYLRGGIHPRTNTFALSALDSGSPGAPVVYAAFPGETPILTTARTTLSSQWSPLAASELSRVLPGVDTNRIWELNVSGNTRATNFPSVFNEWVIFNALRTTLNGGQLEVFRSGERMRLSRYPNVDSNDDTATPVLSMNGVATGAASDGSGYLNGAGTYTLGSGGTVQVGGAFHYNAADADRVARWQTALSRGGLWLGGYWRVPWQVNHVRVSVVDPVKQVLGFVTNSSNATNPVVSNGIGDKYTRPVGSKKEPWWVVNLLEEMDQPGEWAIDFSRQRLYFLMDRAGAPADGEIELSDNGNVLFQLNGATDVRLRGLTFRRHLGINIQMTNSASRNLVLGCRFEQAGNMAVDINGGTNNGVVSSDFEKLASGGVMLRGGSLLADGTPVAADHFAVNNKFRSFGEVVRVYQAAVDIGYGGPMGSWGLPTVGMRAAHNDIRTSPHAGILWNGHRHHIEFNEVSDFTRISNDLGAIYRYGRNADFRTIIRYNHLYQSPLGEGVYNDSDHVRTPVYGNVINLKTRISGSRGYGFWSATHTATGEANTSLPMWLQVHNNISVNTRAGFVLHSETGGRIENNLSYRPITDHFRWSRITLNTNSNTRTISTSDAGTLASGPNSGYSSDPGFIDYAHDDLRLRPDAQAYRDMPGFVPIPLEMSGLYADEIRSEDRVWTPWIATEASLSVGANTVTLAGTLVYPQFDANADVRVYWGTSDGGTDPAAWQNVAELGRPGSGRVTYTPTNLRPGTQYFYRFYAVNAAGEHWAEQANSTTTFPISAAPAGTATASSSATPAGHAFDSNPTTAWRTTDGTVTGTITFGFDGETSSRVTRYAVTSAADFPARDPRSWQFLGSWDGVNWVVLDTRTNELFSSRGQTREFGFINPATYLFYRFTITANQGDATAVQIAELALSSPATAADTIGPVITTPGNLTVPGATSAGAIVNFDVSALDAVSGNVSATASPASGSLFPIGQTTITVTATDAAGNLSTAQFLITVTPPQLPAPWSLQQIQPFAGVAAGTATVNSANSFTIVGQGGSSSGGTTGDMWTGSNDSFTYVSVPWSGDGTFTARLASFTSDDASAKAGIAFRETSATGSRYSAVYLLRKGDAWAQHKTATGGSSSGANFFTNSSTGRGIPEWIRLVREGDTYRCFFSADGVSWTAIGSERLNPMSGASLSVGLVVAPRTGNTTATATFDNLSFTTPLQNWRKLYFGTTESTGSATDLADPDGDGIPNILEYALGRPPATGNTAPPFVMQIVQTEANPLSHLTLTFNRIADPALTYIAEASTDLTTWVPFWSSNGSANQPGEVVVADPAEITGDMTCRFIRLRVEWR